MENLQEEIEENIEVSTSEKQVELSDIMKLLKELAEVQAKRTLVVAGRAAKEVYNGLDNKFQTVKNWVESEERKYGAKQGEAREVISKYSTTLNQIYNIYKESENSCIERREEYQKAEQYGITQLSIKKNEKNKCKADIKFLSKEIKKIEQTAEYKQYSQMIENAEKELTIAATRGNTDTIDSINSKLKRFLSEREALFGTSKEELNRKNTSLSLTELSIKQQKQIIKESRSNAKGEEESIKRLGKSALNSINIAKKEKSKQLAVIQRKNAISKLWDSISAKIGGARRFASNVLKPLQEEIRTIKDEKIPAFKNDIVESLAKKEKELNDYMNKVKDIIEKGEDKIKTAGETAITFGKDLATIAVGGTYLAGCKIANAGKDFASDIANRISGVPGKARDIVDKGKATKQKFLSSISNKLQGKIESVQANLEKQQTNIKQGNIGQEQEK